MFENLDGLINIRRKTIELPKTWQVIDTNKSIHGYKYNK